MADNVTFPVAPSTATVRTIETSGIHTPVGALGDVDGMPVDVFTSTDPTLVETSMGLNVYGNDSAGTPVPNLAIKTGNPLPGDATLVEAVFQGLDSGTVDDVTAGDVPLAGWGANALPGPVGPIDQLTLGVPLDYVGVIPGSPGYDSPVWVRWSHTIEGSTIALVHWAYFANGVPAAWDGVTPIAYAVFASDAAGDPVKVGARSADVPDPMGSDQYFASLSSTLYSTTVAPPQGMRVALVEPPEPTRTANAAYSTAGITRTARMVIVQARPLDPDTALDRSTDYVELAGGGFTLYADGERVTIADPGGNPVQVTATPHGNMAVEFLMLDGVGS